jgi:hypothetical protein
MSLIGHWFFLMLHTVGGKLEGELMIIGIE